MEMENQTFYGRQKEIHLLFDAWQHALDGKPQWVSFVAETGAGKTRLIHEFYRYVSDRAYRVEKEKDNPEKYKFQEDYDPSSYWPDTLPLAWKNLRLNPDPESTTEVSLNALKDIPWLWWGIRGDDCDRRNGSENGCAARDALSRLEIHATLLAIQKERFRGNIAAIQQIGKWVGPKLPVVGPMLEIAFTIGELVQSGKRPFETLLKGHGIQPREEARKLQIKLQDLLVDSIMQFLEQDVPVILVLDDVHWFDVDTVAFVNQLMTRVGEQSLKLMIISTSWAKEWNQSAIRDIFLGFSGTPIEESVGAIEPEYIRGFLLSNFPGLSEADLVLLTDRADRNFQYATELVLALRMDPVTFFEDADTSLGLSALGREEAGSKNLEMDRLIESRFLALDRSIQTALMRSSYQGTRFDPKLTSLVAHAIEPEAADAAATIEAINLAERPGAMVCSVEADLREFLRGPYWQLIRKRQDKGKDLSKIKDAYRRIVDQSDIDVAEPIIESLILQWLGSEQDVSQVIRMRAWLLEITTKSRRYQAGLHHLTEIATLMAEQDRSGIRNIQATFAPTAAVAALRIFNQYIFGAGKKEHLESLEKLCVSLCLSLQAPIFRYLETRTLPEGHSLSHLIDWCEVLVSFRMGLGHMNDYIRWLRHLGELQKTQLDTSSATSNVRVLYIGTLIRLAEASSPLSQDRQGWDQIFHIFQGAGAEVGRLAGPDRAIFFAWVQISILYFGRSGRSYYPEVANWGDDHENYCKCAEKLGDVLVEIVAEHSADAGGEQTELGDELLEALLHAASLLIEFAYQNGYPLATEFSDRLRLVSLAVFDRIQAGGYVPISLASAAMEAELNVANILHWPSVVPHVGDGSDEFSARETHSVRIKNGALAPEESLRIIARLSSTVNRYRQLGMLSIEMIRIFARISHDRLVLSTAGADEAVQVFESMVNDAALTKDGERVRFGEQIQLLPWLVRIFDIWLIDLPGATTLWQRLRDAYPSCSDTDFNAAVEKCRYLQRGT